MAQGNTNEYIAYFDFTTVDKRSHFVGRSGQIGVTSTMSFNEIKSDTENIHQMCVAYVQCENPKWNIFSLTVTSIVEAPTKEKA